VEHEARERASQADWRRNLSMNNVWAFSVARQVVLPVPVPLPLRAHTRERLEVAEILTREVQLMFARFAGTRSRGCCRRRRECSSNIGNSSNNT